MNRDSGIVIRPSVMIGHLKIDEQARRVWKDAQELHLTRLEYEVLEYLARRAGEMVPYAELWREVWGHTSPLGECGQRTVRQCIKRMRHKLGERWEAPHFLRCAWGLGFRFENRDLEIDT